LLVPLLLAQPELAKDGRFGCMNPSAFVASGQAVGPVGRRFVNCAVPTIGDSLTMRVRVTESVRTRS
jgi:hypothetical protein